MRTVTVMFVASDRLKSDPFHTCRMCANALCSFLARAKYTVCAKPQTNEDITRPGCQHTSFWRGTCRSLLADAIMSTMGTTHIFQSRPQTR